MGPMKYLVRTLDGDDYELESWLLVEITDNDLLRIQGHRQAFLSAQAVSSNTRYIAVSSFLKIGYLMGESFERIQGFLGKEDENSTQVVFHPVHDLVLVADQDSSVIEVVNFNEVGLSFSNDDALRTFYLPYEALREAPEARSNVSIDMALLNWRDDSQGEDGSRLSTIIRIGLKDFHLVAHAVSTVEDEQVSDGMSSDYVALNVHFGIREPQQEVTINDRQYVLFGHASAQ